ncbi:MAG: alpha/beta fold hydrolase, partial [Myxococcota bacterium]
MLLIHGIGAARNTWAKALPILTSHFTVITYDLRGHGDSPLPDVPFDLDALVADVEWVRARTG